MNKIHVLVVMRWPVGGIRTFCRYVYNNFDKRKFKFTILAPSVNELDTLIDDLKGYDICLIKTSFSGDMAYLKYSMVVKTILFGHYDIIHSHGLSAGLYCSLPAKLKRIPHMMTCHDVFTENQFIGINGLVKKMVISCLLSFIDKIHYVSHDARDNIFEYIPILKLFRNKNFVALNGINVDQFINATPRNFHKEMNLPDNTFIVGFMGRFMAQKGFTYLVGAVDILVKKNNVKNLKVLCFGWGGYIREEQENIHKKNLDDYFIFLPFTANVASSLKGLDVLAVPSLWEACPLLPMEAMVVGVPIVGTDCIGLREVLKNNKSSVKMISSKDSIALALALKSELIKSSKNESNIFKNKAIELFDVRLQAKDLEKMFISLYSKKYYFILPRSHKVE